MSEPLLPQPLLPGPSLGLSSVPPHPAPPSSSSSGFERFPPFPYHVSSSPIPSLPSPPLAVLFLFRFVLRLHDVPICDLCAWCDGHSVFLPGDDKGHQNPALIPGMSLRRGQCGRGPSSVPMVQTEVSPSCPELAQAVCLKGRGKARGLPGGGGLLALSQPILFSVPER